MQDTNLTITPEELRLMQDTSFFETKHQVMKKITALLGDLQAGLDEITNGIDYNLLPEGVFRHLGKISRGENYLGYPYLVLDYPRIFEKQDVFAFRSMFWWGKHFSYTIHVGGKYYETVKNNFVKNYKSLKQKGMYVCVNENPWEYHFGKNNFLPTGNVQPDQLIEQKLHGQGFLKLSLLKDLSQWQHIRTDGIHAFGLFTKVLYG